MPDDLKLMPSDPEKKFLLDPYLDWTKGEGLPVYEDFGLDAFECTTGPWARFDAKGAFLHVAGRGDFVSCFALEMAPGRKTAPIKHLFEMVCYVIDGQGSTTIWTPDGRKHSFEWAPKSMFAIPLNCRYQHFNGSGRERALIACTHDLPLVMNLFHNHEFVFDNPFTFQDRVGDPKYFDGDGDFIEVKPGRHMWETNFVPDLTALELKSWDARGKGSANICFVLADGTMHAHISQIPTARYKKGHRHMNGVHIFAVNGSGYTLTWYEGDNDFRKIPWRHGIIYAPAFWMFHQHFNTAPEPARYMAIAIGSRRYPFTEMRRKGVEGAVDTSIAKGGRQVEYEDQDPRIHPLWLEEIARNHVASQMGDIFDETALAGRL